MPPLRKYYFVKDSNADQVEMRQKLAREKIRNVSMVSSVDYTTKLRSDYICEVTKSPRAPEYKIHYLASKKDALETAKGKSRTRKKPPYGSLKPRDVSTASEDDSKLESDSTEKDENMVGLRVIACYRKDGLYYPGSVSNSVRSAYAIVNFNFQRRQKVRTQMIIPISGAIPRPELDLGDFVLVRVYNQSKDLECYVPAIIEFLPGDQRHHAKFYSVLMYNGQRATTMRKYIVKIGQARFEMAVRYISHIQNSRRDRDTQESDSTARSHDTRDDSILSDQSTIRSVDSRQSRDSQRRRKKEKYTKKLVEKTKESTQKRKPRSPSDDRSSRSNSRSRSNGSRSNSARSKSTYTCSSRSSRRSRSSSSRSTLKNKSRSRSASSKYSSRSRSRSGSGRSRSHSRGNGSSRSRSRSGSGRRSRRRSRPGSRKRSRSQSRGSWSSRNRSRSGSQRRSRSQSRRSLSSRSRSRSGSRRRSRSQSRRSSSSRSRSRSRSWSRSYKTSRSRRSTRSRSRSKEKGYTSSEVACDDVSTPRASPIERPSNPVPKPRPRSPAYRSDSIVTRPLGEAQQNQFEEKDQMIEELQYKLDKQTRKQIRQERRLVRQARKINKIQRKMTSTEHSYNESTYSEKIERSRSVLQNRTVEKDSSPERRNGSPDGTSLRESPDVSAMRRSLPGLRRNQEVLARWSDDGWYYRGMVGKEGQGTSYWIRDNTGHSELIAREHILTEEGHKCDAIQPQDCVIGLHPKYVFSYAPAEVLEVYTNHSVKVEFYDGNIAKLPFDEVFQISRVQHEQDTAFIMTKEKQIQGKSVVARDNDDGKYRLGVVDSRVGLGQQYYIKWLDGMICKQNANHMFEVATRQAEHAQWEYVLAPVDKHHIHYMPGHIVCQEPLRVQFCDGSSSSELRLQQCFWITKDYYRNAVDYIYSKTDGVA